jgi:shikimate kinase
MVDSRDDKVLVGDASLKLADHIIIIGFMGAGKSSVARKLARFEKMNSIDMDIYIEREAGMRIPQIFETEGEAGFRQRETAFLESMFKRDRCILSCGGGVVTREENRRILKLMGTVVYLEVDAQEAVSRISRPETRPLLSGSTPPEDLLETRRPFYEDAADITVDTTKKTPTKVAAEVKTKLRKIGVL